MTKDREPGDQDWPDFFADTDQPNAPPAAPKTNASELMAAPELPALPPEALPMTLFVVNRIRLSILELLPDVPKLKWPGTIAKEVNLLLKDPKRDAKLLTQRGSASWPAVEKGQAVEKSGDIDIVFVDPKTLLRGGIQFEFKVLRKDRKLALNHYFPPLDLALVFLTQKPYPPASQITAVKSLHPYHLVVDIHAGRWNLLLRSDLLEQS